MGDSFCGDDEFWGNWTDDTDFPHLTKCFDHTLLVYLPAAFLIVLLPFIFVQARRIGRRFDPLPVTALFVIRLLINIYLFLNATAVLVLNAFFIDGLSTVDIVYPCVWMFFFLLHLVIDWNRSRCGQISSGIQHLSLILLAICGVPEMGYQFENSTYDNDTTLPIFCLYMGFWPVVVIQCLLYCWADKRRPETDKSEELDSSFINRLTNWWFTPVQIRGAKKDLEMDDIFDLNPGSKSVWLAALFEKYWINQMKDYIEKRHLAEKAGDAIMPVEPSLIKALFRMFKYEFLSATMYKLISDTLLFVNPFLLNELITFVSDAEAPFWQGLSYAILMFVVSESRSIILNQYNSIMMRMGMKLQTALTAAVYRKTLRLSASARRKKTVGEIINHMAIDIEIFQNLTPQVQMYWSTPYQARNFEIIIFLACQSQEKKSSKIIVALIYLSFTLGYSAAPGIVIMILYLPLNIFTSLAIKKWQARDFPNLEIAKLLGTCKMTQMKLKDERVKMVNEVLNGIKVVKLYAWEEPMEKHINAIRVREIALVRKAGMVQSLLDTINSASPFLVSAASFGTFILSSDEHILTPQIAFVSLTLFNQLKMPMMMIAFIINMTVQAMVSNRRLRGFLLSEEIDDSKIKRDENANGERLVPTLSSSTTLTPHGKKPVMRSHGRLFDLLQQSLAPRGAFVAVVGAVGSGKSTFLSAMLGDLNILKGDITVTGRLAYVPQQAWIQNLSVRDNITFGKPFVREWYEKVVSACALAPDLAILPDGDATEIGEKGINLSGGQKARVSLARAVYQQDDVYLLDDPLSAVDAHVGRHLYTHVSIKNDMVLGPRGLLAGKTRLLVTHSLLHTREADEILVFHDGVIAEKGSHDHLVKQGGMFAKLMEEYASSAEAEEEEEAEEEDVDDGTKVEEEKKAVHKAIGRGSIVAEEKKLIKKEQMESGGVKLTVYLEYLKAASISFCLIFIIMYGSAQALSMLRTFWLSAWSNENDPAFNGTKMDQGERLGIYCAIGVGTSMVYYVAVSAMVIVGVRASRQLHSPLVHNLMRSPISFFDTTPTGRILNRCSKDIDTIDSQLVQNLKTFIQCVFGIVTTLVMIVTSTPIFVVVIIPLAIIYILILRFYVPTSRQLKRLESIHRSPVYSHFGETIQGVAIIRAYGKVAQFCLDSEAKVDKLIQCRYLNVVSNRWLSVRLEFIGNCVFDWGISAGLVGVSVSYALNITDVLNYAVIQMSSLESNIVCVERVVEYTRTPNEAEWVDANSGVTSGWPSDGGVHIDNYSTRYREGLDLVLKGINARVRPGEKIGIVGRTGAGKSSFALALFRMIEPAGGSINIDGRSTSSMGLHELRKRLTIIPQEPVLFSGSVRFNLDPFGDYSDDQLWKALELAHLESFSKTLTNGLEHKISEGGENISVGQRQLVCLARATLRSSKILVLDEATAAVDLQTDNLIQATIRSHFKHCTVFTIAHRLNTILDYDRIMVMDKGEVAEMDSPAALMADKNSLFSKMLADAENENK
ncbi:hypothetical protein PRIPAC_91093 [Pristionchus pacificus]|uniref:ABC transporter ATP-binding protein n=1 Tax=Pristionchus pacificus TaxID=54126 RepID=A0A2A6CW42_PRIPA|nr:hypothetical protein PRIPAC_91093 [Pristionchus pacificus]|eukprot:PDM82452.1 ABC transporter ATP-binding protein [Pristionchus pacificus]